MPINITVNESGPGEEVLDLLGRLDASLLILRDGNERIQEQLATMSGTAQTNSEKLTAEIQQISQDLATNTAEVGQAIQQLKDSGVSSAQLAALDAAHASAVANNKALQDALDAAAPPAPATAPAAAQAAALPADTVNPTGATPGAAVV